ncbi:MAG TPA: hypothetical protein VFZ53_11970 [Polyangiaceae bacterium]
MAFVGGSALVQLVALGLPAAGSAEAPIPIRIVFDAPADCSTDEAFFQGVRSRTDRVRRAEAGETGTELGVRVTKTSGKVHGELDLIGEHGESDRRVVDGETCDEVVEALSLTAALALDPTARVEPARPAPAAPPPPATAPPPCPPAPPSQAVPKSFELGLHARAAVASVVTPEWSIGGLALATLRPVALVPNGPSFGFGVGYLSNSFVVSEEAGEQREVATRLTTVLLRACPLRFAAAVWLRIEPCAVGKGGFLEAEASGFSNPESVARTWWSLGAEMAVEVGWGSGFSVELAPSLDVPLVERRFTTGEPPEPAGDTPVVSAGVSLGIGYYFQ